MTQPELDFVFNAPALLPRKDGNRVELEISDKFVNPNAKTKIKSITLYWSRTNKRSRNFMQIGISHRDREKNSVLAQYASRFLDSDDDRFAEYRLNFASIVQTLYANGVLYSTPSLDAFTNPKGFRWCQKAYCSCGCSPAYSFPFGLKAEYGNMEISVVLEEKPDAEVEILYSKQRYLAVLGKPVAQEQVGDPV